MPRKAHVPTAQPKLAPRDPDLADDAPLPAPAKPEPEPDAPPTGPEYWTVIIYDDGAPYVRKCVTAQAANAMGEAIHHYSVDRNLNVNRIAGALVIPAGAPIVLARRPWEYDDAGSADGDVSSEIPPRHQDVAAAEPIGDGAADSKDAAPAIDSEDLPWT